jgi:hypothetical protein
MKMLVDAAKHLGLPIMHRKPMQSERLVRGSLSHHLLANAGITELVLLFCAFSANQNGLKPLFTPCRAEGKGSCITSTLCPEPCRQVLPSTLKNAASMLF